jgi:hypothetical protein
MKMIGKKQTKSKDSSAYSSALKMDTVYSSETSMNQNGVH